jgi:hypothetical protein
MKHLILADSLLSFMVCSVLAALACVAIVALQPNPAAIAAATATQLAQSATPTR